MKKTDDTAIPFLSNQCYHIYNRGNNRQNIFYQERNYYYFLKKYAEYMESYLVTYAYCLLPNHFHILARAKEQAEILKSAKNDFPTIGRYTVEGWSIADINFQSSTKAKFSLENILSKLSSSEDLEKITSWAISEKIRRWLMGYAKAINKQENLEGSLFRKKVRRKRVDDDSYFKFLVWYIHNNPIHHNIFHSLLDYQHSSYRSLITTQPTKLKREFVLEWYGGKEEFVKYHKEMTLSSDNNDVKFWIE